MGGVPAIQLLPGPDPDAEPAVPNDAVLVPARQQHANGAQSAPGARILPQTQVPGEEPHPSKEA